MKGEFHTPSLGDFVPDPIWFHDVAGGWFTLDRLMVVRLFVVLLVALLFALAFRNPKLVPGKLQNAAEMVLDFVRTGVAEDILGKREGKRFLPLITATFVLVFFLNLPSIIPFLNVSPNARIGMPFVLAIVGYIAFIYAGSRKYGFFKFMKSSVVIPNMPAAMHIIVVPIEFISTFILRPVTLTIRLMANMLSGHLILALIFAATDFFFWQFNGWTVLSAVTLVASVLFTLFELLVIFLQAYIFALLVAVYTDLSLHAGEH